MKVLTWNINGIRSVKKGQTLKKLFDSLGADIVCLQETKVTREMLAEETAIVEGYNAYFSFSKVRSGYSGVATFCHDRVTPIKAEDKIHLPVEQCESDDLTAEENCLTQEELELLNAEGRSVITEHLDTDGNHVVLMNLYCPRADLDNKERTEFKLKFYSLIEKKCKSLLQENKHVIVLGDFNVSHKLIDHCDPDDPEIFESNPSRKWAMTFIWEPTNDEQKANPLTSLSGKTPAITQDTYDETFEEIPKDNDKQKCPKFIDSFRFFHPQQKSAFTCWSTITGARQTNYGTRIDYIFSSVDFFKKEFTDCVIRPDIEGSDHCPVVATLKTTLQNGGKPPSLCTKYMPEFSGKQRKLRDFFKTNEGDANLSKVNDNKMDEVLGSEVSVKSSEMKRPADSQLKTHSKRFKTNAGPTQGKIVQFFGKKNTQPRTIDNLKHRECIESGNKMVSDGTTNANQKYACTVEEKSETDLKLNTDNVESRNALESVNTSSQTSTSSGEYSSSPFSTPTPPDACQPDSQDSLEGLRNVKDTKETSAAVVSSWKKLLKGPPPAPLCSGHKEPCVLRTVKNKGPNHGKKFYCCARPQGHSTNKEARCNYFTWVKK